jgi:hypothetical protein
MIFIHRTAEPGILQQKGNAKRLTLCTAYDDGVTEFNFESGIYADSSVKEALISMKHVKCCFCESKITHISYGDVEHYRPKAGYKQDESEPLQKPGYYWLAYEWDNLLLSCTLCNQQYKKNLFPLLAPEKRARNHHDDIAIEQPLLINPTHINPQDCIGFHEEVPYAIDDNPYGKTTIAVFGLDKRVKLNEERRTILDRIRITIDLIKIANKQSDNSELQTLAEEAKLFLENAILPKAEYSAMATAYIDENLQKQPLP